MTRSDLQARVISNSASLDCVLLRQRLLYISRVLRKAPPTLLALLCARKANDEFVSLWTQQVGHDLKFLYDNARDVRTQLPHPAVDPGAWSDFMISKPETYKTVCAFHSFLLVHL